jgi:hypothetical protein
MPLTANIVGVGAFPGDDAFLEGIVRWARGLPIDKKSGVGPKGENCSTLEDEDRAARYGRFQCMNLGYLQKETLGKRAKEILTHYC